MRNLTVIRAAARPKEEATTRRGEIPSPAERPGSAIGRVGDETTEHHRNRAGGTRGPPGGRRTPRVARSRLGTGCCPGGGRVARGAGRRDSADQLPELRDAAGTELRTRGLRIRAPRGPARLRRWVRGCRLRRGRVCRRVPGLREVRRAEPLLPAVLRLPRRPVLPGPVLRAAVGARGQRR